MPYHSQPTGELKNHALTSNGVEGQVSGDLFHLAFYEEAVVRITFSRDKDLDFPSYAVISHPGSPKLTFDDQSSQILIASGLIRVTINKSPLRIDFADSEGNTVVEDDPAFGITINESQISCFKKLRDNERFVGLGEKVGPLNRRGAGFTHWNTDNFDYGTRTDPLYSSIPFYIGIHDGIAYGIFLDNSSRTDFNFGASNNRFTSFSVEAGNLDYYLIYGPKVSDVIRRYTWLTGRMELPPLWSLGYQQCRYSYFPESEVKGIARTFREKNIPCDAIVLDIHYMEGYKIFTWDSQRFPDPERMIANLKQDGFETVVICDPGVKVEKGYEPFEDGVKNNIFLKYPDGTDFEAEVWPGLCRFPDFTNPEGRTWWMGKIKYYTDLGVEGFWNDMNEIASWGHFLPDIITYDYEGTKVSSKLGRNVYGFQMARTSYDGAKEHLENKRPFNLTRSGFAGMQRVTAKWTGDNTASEDHMLLGVRLVNSLGLSGVSFAGYDIGGFQKEPTTALFCRWMAIGAFSPFYRGHSAVNTRDAEPWAFGEEAEEICRNYISLHYKLLPYLYSCFYESTQNGMPVQRSLAIDFAEDPKIYEERYQNQYLFGPGILVAPVRSDDKICKVYLPRGDWFDFFTGKWFPGESEIYCETPLGKVPVFVKASSVLFSISAIPSTKKYQRAQLYLHVYHGKRMSVFRYYEDDGSSFDYQEGRYLIKEIYYDGEGSELTLGKSEGDFTSSFSRLNLVLHGFKERCSFRIDGNTLHTKNEIWSFVGAVSTFDPIKSESQVTGEKVVTASVPFGENPITIHWDEE